jgi:glycosyltransferase involved in cell wall biosynthesis
LAELLSICIPTYNRAAYLQEILRNLGTEYQALPEAAKADVRFYVSDNASADNTRTVVEQHQSAIPLAYTKNSTNIGAEPNFFKLIDVSKGRYKWILGDDDLIEPGTLFALVNFLREKQPCLLVIKVCDPSGVEDRRFADSPELFPDFRAFLDHCAVRNPALLVAMSLVSCNVFEGKTFDCALASRLYASSQYPYSWLYGVVSKLGETQGPVAIWRTGRVILRDNTATGPVRARAETTLPRWFNLDWRVRVYLKWVAQKFNKEEIDRWAARHYPLRKVHPVMYWLRMWGRYLYYGLRKRPVKHPALRSGDV